jgi:hypothetical protein
MLFGKDFFHLTVDVYFIEAAIAEINKRKKQAKLPPELSCAIETMKGSQHQQCNTRPDRKRKYRLHKLC